MLKSFLNRWVPLKLGHQKAKHRRRPANLIYGTEDTPPQATSVVLGFQHAVESASKITLPVALLTAIGASAQELETMIVATLVMSGIGSMVAASRLPVFGFGHLIPMAIFSSFVSAAVLAARLGGLALLAGMTLITGMAICLLSRVLPRWRFLFPPEVVGLIAFMVGASQSSLAVMRFLGMDRVEQQPGLTHIIIAGGSLALLAGLTVWGKGPLRLFSSLITLVVGYIVCLNTGMVKPELWQRVLDAPWIGLPVIHPPGLAFDGTLILPFLVLGLSATLKSSGDLTICEKISDADWKRADLKASSAAVLTFGLSSMASALLGGFAMMSSSSNVGLSAATGAVSRRIGYYCGGALISLAFFPKMVALVGAAPPPVVGAMLLLVVSYNLIAGMQIIMTRMMEARHTYIIGISLLFGLTTDAIPGAFRDLPSWLRPLFSSGLTLATVLVVLLNLIFRIGTSRRHKIVLDPNAEDVDKIYDFMEESGAQWGARREVVERAVSALVEGYEVLAGEGLAKGPITVQASFDEFSLDLNLRYDGLLPEIGRKALSPEEALSGGVSTATMAGLLLSRLSDRVRTKSSGRTCELDLHFEH